MFHMVLLSYVLAHGGASASVPVVGAYASLDECRNAASHMAWTNAHDADNSQFGVICLQDPGTKPRFPRGKPPKR